MPRAAFPRSPRPTPSHAAGHDGIALVLVLCALLVLSFVVISLARRVDQSVFLAGRELHALDSRALAFTGAQYALHPQSTVRTPVLRSQTGRGRSYQARIIGEGGKLQLNWALAGEDPAKVDLLKEYLRLKGLKAEECDVFVDCLLDFTTPGNVHHLNGSQTAIDGAPVPGKPFGDLSEVRRVVGNEPLTRQPNWENGFTLYSQGPIDLKWADEDLIGALPGVGRDRARAFIQRRQGPDKLDGTPDDYPMNTVADAAALLGFNQGTLAQLQSLLGVNDPTVRIISEGRALDTSRTIEVVARKTGMQPQILQWKEY